MSTLIHTRPTMNPARDSELERLARRRASARLGWYAHAMVYLAVNAVLMLMAFGTGRTWALFPALGWGLGLAIHGVVVYLVTGGAGLYDRLIQRERDQLAARRDQP